MTAVNTPKLSPRQRLAPEPTVDPADYRGAPRAGRGCSCPVCDKRYAEAAIVTDALQWDDREGCWVKRRRAFCDHCEGVIHWVEQVTPMGALTGVVVRGPGLVRQRGHVERFLRDHPAATGVLQR